MSRTEFRRDDNRLSKEFAQRVSHGESAAPGVWIANTLSHTYPEASPMHDRRSFLLATGAVIAGSSATSFAANETLNVGLIGTGGRCRALTKSLITIPNVKVVAISDVRDDSIAEA